MQLRLHPALGTAALFLLTASCVPPRAIERTLRPASASGTLDRRSEFLKVHMRDGTVLVLRAWAFQPDARTVQGQGWRLGVNRDTLRAGMLEVPVDSVLLFETNVLEKPSPRTALTILTVATAAIGLACITNPKVCFGSCPTFYAGSGERILAEGFSSSISPALEATDVDRLELAPVRDSSFELRMTNEALETHVLRSVRLLAFEAEAGSTVYSTGSAFWRVGAPVAPHCTARSGDCSAAVAAADEHEWFSATDSTDLGARELVELAFDVRAAGEYGLLIRSRQTLLHTYVLYQTLAYMGQDAGRWLAALQRGDAKVLQGFFALGRALGGIEVLGADTTRRVASIYETGPLAADTRLVPVGPLTPGIHTIHLRLARGHWRLDRVALAPMLQQAQPIALLPSTVLLSGSPNPAALSALRDRTHPLTTLPGDEYRIRFDLPRSDSGLEVFLETRGYYLEWLRSEWLTDENPERARIMLFEPLRGLRMLAPEFKKWEPRMEDLFWKSRYAPR